MNRVYCIGNVVLLLDEVIAIEKEHRDKSNSVFLPIHLRGGQKIHVEIIAVGEERVGSTDPYSQAFLNRFQREIEDFIIAFYKHAS